QRKDSRKRIARTLRGNARLAFRASRFGRAPRNDGPCCPASRNFRPRRSRAEPVPFDTRNRSEVQRRKRRNQLSRIYVSRRKHFFHDEHLVNFMTTVSGYEQIGNASRATFFQL